MRGLAALAVLVGGLLALAPAAAPAAKFKKITLGYTKGTPTPDCPTTLTRVCSVEGRVTGFQAIAAGSNRARPFVAPANARIVAWSISLSRPRKKDFRDTSTSPPTLFAAEQPTLNYLFGNPSTARISVLKEGRKKDGQKRFTMVRQSPTVILNPYFGTVATFALEEPMPVKRGQVVALTIPTWAPAFWHNRGCDILASSDAQVDPAACARAEQTNRWRASRPKGECLFTGSLANKKEQAERSHPHQKVNSTKPYGCYYSGSRLLYTATLVRPR